MRREPNKIEKKEGKNWSSEGGGVALTVLLTGKTFGKRDHRKVAWSYFRNSLLNYSDLYWHILLSISNLFKSFESWNLYFNETQFLTWNESVETRSFGVAESRDANRGGISGIISAIRGLRRIEWLQGCRLFVETPPNNVFVRFAIWPTTVGLLPPKNQ